MKKGMATKALVSLIMGVILIFAFLGIFRSYTDAQNTYSEKDAFNALDEGLNKLDLDESGKFVSILNEGSAFFFFDKDTNEISFSDKEIEKPLTCQNKACVCFCSRCEFTTTLKGNMICRDVKTESFFTNIEGYAGGVIVDNNLVSDITSNTIYSIKTDEQTMGICTTLPCEK